MLCQTVTKVLVIVVLGVGLMLLCSKLFYCLRLPIQSNARGGDQNASLGINAAWQLTLFLSPVPYPILGELSCMPKGQI